MKNTAQILRHFPFLFWVVLFILFMGGSSFFGHTINKTDDKELYYILCWGYSLACITIPIAIKICYGILINLSPMLKHFVSCKNEEIVPWFIKELDIFNGSSATYLAGVCLGLLATVVGLTFHLGVYDSHYVKWFAVLILFTSHFWAGAGLFMMYSLSKIFYRLGNLSECTIQVENHEFGILGVGIALTKCWAIFVCVWIFYQIPLLTILKLNSATSLPPAIILTMPIATIIFGLFIYCQIPLHRRMVQYKQNEIVRFQALLEEISPRKVHDISEELIKNNMFLEKKYKHAQSLPTWPISFASTSAVALAPVLFEILKPAVNEIMTKIT